MHVMIYEFINNFNTVVGVRSLFNIYYIERFNRRTMAVIYYTRGYVLLPKNIGFYCIMYIL